MELSVIQNMIYEIRGARVMLDFDLAAMYHIETKALKQAVRRNLDRFEGEDFMFELSEDEYNSLKIRLRSQNVTLENNGRGKFSKYPPFVFTEIGVAMLSSVLKNDIAIIVNRNIMRAFVAMRNYILSTKTLNAEINELKAKMALLEKNDEDNLEAINDLSEDIRKEIDSIYQAIGALSTKLSPAVKPRTKIGFKTSYGE